MSQRSLMNASISVSLELAPVGVDAHGVAREEQVAGVVVELRPLVRSERVLDGQLVQAELGRQLVQLVVGRAAEVDPHDGVRLLEVLRDLRDGKPSASRTPFRYTRVWAWSIGFLHAVWRRRSGGAFSPPVPRVR